MMSSNHLILCRPLLLLPSIFPSIRVSSGESVLHIRWPEYWSFSFSISPSNEHSGLISFRMDFPLLFPVPSAPATQTPHCFQNALSTLLPQGLCTCHLLSLGTLLPDTSLFIPSPPSEMSPSQCCWLWLLYLKSTTIFPTSKPCHPPCFNLSPLFLPSPNVIDYLIY